MTFEHRQFIGKYFQFVPSNKLEFEHVQQYRFTSVLLNIDFHAINLALEGFNKMVTLCMRYYENIRSSWQNTVFSWPCCTEVSKFKLPSPKQTCIYAFFIQLLSELWHYLTYSAHAPTGSHVQIYNHSSPSQLYSPYNRW